MPCPCSSCFPGFRTADPALRGGSNFGLKAALDRSAPAARLDRQREARCRVALTRVPNAMLVRPAFRGHCANDLASVAAIAVLYHPRPELLSRLIRSVASQVDKIFIVDNTPVEQRPCPRELEGCGCPSRLSRQWQQQGACRSAKHGIAYALARTIPMCCFWTRTAHCPAAQWMACWRRNVASKRAANPWPPWGPCSSTRKPATVRAACVGHGFPVHWFSIPPEETKPVEADYLISSGIAHSCQRSEPGGPHARRTVYRLGGR